MAIERPDTSLHVLRLCSVFEPDDDQIHRPGYDPIGGMQNHTAALTRALDQRGVQQTVITSRLGAPARSKPFGRRARLVRTGLPIRRFRQGWAMVGARLVARGGSYDLVHVHQGEDLAALPLGVAMARRLGCPLVVTLHCSLRHSVPAADRRLAMLHSVGGSLEHRMLACAHTVIALTETTAQRIGGGRHRTVVIPSGVETGLFTGARPAPELADVPGPRILYLGRLARQKDVPTLVDAFGRMRREASLVIVGDGPDRPAVEAAVRALPDGASRRVFRFGFQRHRDVPGFLLGADVLVLPSIYEEMGSVLAEALQAGLPVVASDVGGIPRVVHHGRTGILVPPADPDCLARALDELVANPADLARMSAASRALADRYAWDGLAERILDVYRGALGQRPAPSPFPALAFEGEA
jgi:glycogen(starch) synthase